jgi:tetratricopeptide (TPR) repeat protein
VAFFSSGRSRAARRRLTLIEIVTVPIFLALLLALSAAPQSAEMAQRSRAASEAMQKGRFDDAARIYGELLQALPNDPGLLMNLGMALAMGGHEAQAIGPLEHAVKLKPSLTPAQLFLGSSYLALGAADKAVQPLQRVIAAEPANIEYRRMLAQAYVASGKALEAAVQLRRVTELSPRLPYAWFALFHAYNAVAQDAVSTFAEEPEASAWRDLLVADALLSDGRFTDAFAIYRDTVEALPRMVSIHDSMATIYERTGHADWAAVERRKGVLTPAQCLKRKALCEFRAGRYRAALTAALAANDPEWRYWRARAATELGKAAFAKLDALPDSRERRELRAAMASADRRHADAVTELRAALKHAPDDQALLARLGVALHASREYEEAVSTLSPLVTATPPVEDVDVLTAYGDALLQLDRVDEAIAVLRRAFTADTSDRAASLALARAYLRKNDFRAALPLLEWQLEGDGDGSVHVQLARALAGMGQQDRADTMLARSQEIQRAAQERAAEAGRRTIAPPR